MSTATKRKRPAAKTATRKKAGAAKSTEAPADANHTRNFTVEELRDQLRDFDPSKLMRALQARRRLSHHYDETPYRICSTGMPDPWTVIALLAKEDVAYLCEIGGSDFADAVCRLQGFVLTGYISRKVQMGYANLILAQMWQYRSDKISSHFREAIARELCRLFHASHPWDLCGDEDGYLDFTS